MYHCSHPHRVLSRVCRRPVEPRDAHTLSCCMIYRIHALACVIEDAEPYDVSLPLSRCFPLPFFFCCRGGGALAPACPPRSLDLVGQILPPSSKGHKFILVATDYFTKWVGAIPLKMVTSNNMVDFVKEQIVYHFGIPQTITTDQGTMFTSEEFRDFAASMGIKLLNSSPYYAQTNGQVEASNQIMIKLIKKNLRSNQGIGTYHSMRHCRHKGWLTMDRLSHHLMC